MGLPWFRIACCLALCARFVDSQSFDSLDGRSDPEPSHACGDLIREAQTSGVVPAIDVYNCWNTVPLNTAVATRLIQYWNDTIQFQSTLDYLKTPPPGYQQPAVDLVAALGEVQAAVDGGGFANEYQFEAALQNVLFSGNDAHLSFFGGVLSSFSFGSAHALTSLSLDGVELPKVYFTDDLILHQYEPDPSWQPSAISQIDGTDAIDYLTRFAALNSYGTSEPHADWNLLVYNPVVDVLGGGNVPLWNGGATFYPGDTFTYVFENGSTLQDQWLAAYLNPLETGPLETGGDFYNFFVLGFYPASYDDTADDSDSSDDAGAAEPPPTSLSNISSAFPEADVWSTNLTETGFLTGYFLHEESLAVLSIPTFWADGDAIRDFADTVQKFLSGAKAAGMSRVLIDLQQNAGGDIVLAYSTFKQFFPAIEPFAGSVMRANPLADILGTTITAYWESLDPADWQYQDASADEWIATTKINAATGQNFTSWEELFGPQHDAIADFTLTERFNVSNYLLAYSMLGQEEPPAVLFESTAGDAPYAAEDIIMLSDGFCASACSLFLEMMSHDAGVKNVVIGGRPTNGPMQTPSGSRGARFYDLDSLAIDVENAFEVANITGLDASALLPLNYSDFFFSGGVSLRAQVREGETVPLAMQYEAADCRLFWTADTFNNFTNLWKQANEAATSSPSLCVQGSTGYAGGASALAPPERPHLAPVVNYTSSGTPSLDLSDAQVPFLVFDQPLPDVPGGFVSSTVRPIRNPQSGRSIAQPLTPAERAAQRQMATDRQRQADKIRRQKQESLRTSPSCARGAPSCGLKRKRRTPVASVGA